MEQVKNTIIVLIIISLTSSCTSGNFVSTEYKKILKKQQENLTNSLHHGDIVLSIFPKKLTNVRESLFAPPTCPPDYNCMSQHGLFYIVYDTLVDNETFFKANQFTPIYSANYSDTNSIIEIYKDSTFKPLVPVNIFYSGHPPVPYFYTIDFGLNNECDQQTNSSMDTISNTWYPHYNVPKDLVIYVLHSYCGQVWKFDCNEIRPVDLGECKHGYSNGFAISHSTKTLIIWGLVW
jgi:hypothetical protein